MKRYDFLNKEAIIHIWDKIKEYFVQKEVNKGLSTNDFDNTYKDKLENIENNAEVNIQSDWNINDINLDSYIKNKPTKTSQFENDSNFPSDENYVHTDNNFTNELKQDIANNVTDRHIHSNKSIIDKISQPLLDTWNTVINKVDKIEGKGLSTEDYTLIEKNKLKDIQSNAEVNIQSDWDISDNINDAYIKNKPIGLSEFLNDQNFINNTIDNLTNYYNKTQSYNKTEVNSLLNTASSLQFLVVESLPIEDISKTIIYLLKKVEPNINDIYNEYINLDGTINGWELIGTTEINLENYYTKIESDNLLNNKADKIEIPIKTSELINDSGYLTSADIETSVTGVKGDNESTYRKGNVNITKDNIGLGNVGNYKSVSTMLNQGLSDEEKLNAKNNIGAFDGNYNNLSSKPVLGTSSSKDIATSGNASTVQVVMGNDTRLSDSRVASDVSTWAKSATKPTYTKSEIGLGNVDNTNDASKNVLSATKLTTARTINGVSFNGTANITIPIPTKLSQLTNDLTGYKTFLYIDTEPTTVGVDEIVFVYET